MRPLRFCLLGLLVAAALLAGLNRGVRIVELPVAAIAIAAVTAGALLAWVAGGARRGLPAALGFVALTLASGALCAQALVFLNQRLDPGAPATLTAVVEAVEPHRGWLGSGDACDVVLQPWRPNRAPLRLALPGSTLVREPSGGADVCRTAEASPLRAGERVALRVHGGAFGLEYLVTEGAESVLTPPCSTCGKGH